MGFRGMSPKQIARMMKKMGIEQKDLEGIREVILRFEDKEWVIADPQVTVIKQSGSETYQIAGVKSERSLTESLPAEGKQVAQTELVIPMEDAALVASQTGVDIDTAMTALKDAEGDLAAAILKLRKS